MLLLHILPGICHLPSLFFDFVSHPPASDTGLGLRVRPSPKEVEALVASLGDLPNDEASSL